MMKSVLGLDLKTGGKVVIWAHLIENIIFYCLSLILMMNSKSVTYEYKNLRSILFYEEEIVSHVKMCKWLSQRKYSE